MSETIFDLDDYTPLKNAKEVLDPEEFVSSEEELSQLEDSDFSHALTLYFAEEQERVALRIANTLGERYGWDAEEKDSVCIEVLGILGQEQT